MRINFLIKVICIIFAFQGSVFSQPNAKKNPKHDYDQIRSGTLIKQYNTLRKLQHLPALKHDTVLDRICSTLISNPIYRNKNNQFNSDSIHSLIHKNGLIDYQYEIREFTDKDTATVFRTFLQTDQWPCVNIGYKRIGNKHLLLKTRSYLKFDHGEAKVHSTTISGFDNRKTSKADVFTDSVTVYISQIVKGKYYSTYTDKIPHQSGEMKNKVRQAGKNCRTSKNIDLCFMANGPDVDKYLVITNVNRVIVAVIR